MNFIRLFTKDGGYYCFDEAHYSEICEALDGEAEWVDLKLAANSTLVTLRVSEIQSFFISTPEGRKSSTEWEAKINSEAEPEEPWKI